MLGGLSAWPSARQWRNNLQLSCTLCDSLILEEKRKVDTVLP